MLVCSYMKSLALLCVLVATAMAEPKEMSRNPRNGLLAQLTFGEGQLRLPEASGSQLGRIAAWAEENFDGLVVIDGHADRTGPSAGNVRLALRRARLVRDQLLALGVDPNQLVISAFGSEKNRRHARVAIWGTHNSAQQVIGARRRAHIDHAPVHARPTPARTRSR